MKPRYPIYIPSKGRADRCHTAHRLAEMDVPFALVVEMSEVEEYRREMPKATILGLPFDNLGQGSIPARNWCWEHAAQQAAPWHWIIDDNIVRFYRLNYNRRIPARTGSIFRAVEEFVGRYENIGLAGLNNIAFGGDRSPNVPPFTLNTRIYSMTLIRTDLPYRWRGRYNEDTDLSLRVLKDGLVTVQFNAFLGDKATTMTMPGGNTDTVYATGDRRLEFAESLARQHPDVATVTWKFGRWHHQVDYSPFKRNRLRRKPGVVPVAENNEFGMRLVKVTKRDRTVTDGHTASRGVTR